MSLFPRSSRLVLPWLCLLAATGSRADEAVTAPPILPPTASDSPAPVATPANTPASLTLADALRLTADRNPSLLAQSYHERAAAALTAQAGLRPNPTLDVTLENFAGSGPNRGVDALEATVQANQAIERGSKRLRRQALANRTREAAAGEFAVKRAEVLSATALAYVELLAAQRRLALSEEQLALAQDTLSAADARVKAAMGNASETARARASLAIAQTDHARNEAAVRNARANLALNWAGSEIRSDLVARSSSGSGLSESAGANSATDSNANTGASTSAALPTLETTFVVPLRSELFAVRGTLAVPAELPAADALLAKLAHHPRVELQKNLIATNRASLELERSNATQDVVVGGGLRFFRDGSDAALVAGVSVPLPFRNKNQGGIQSARETLAGAEQGMRVVELSLRAAFAADWREAQSAHAAVQSLRRDALPAAEDANAVVRRAYAEGQLPLVDVIEAQRALLDLRREILASEIACALALTRVEGLVDSNFPFVTSLLSSQ